MNKSEKYLHSLTMEGDKGKNSPWTGHEDSEGE
jgi:hypothetical protein